MAASKLFCLLGSSIFRNTNPTTIRFTKQLLPTPVVRLRSYSCTPSENNTITETLASSSFHPWPEWVAFVDRLQNKGYFTEIDNSDESIYTNMNVLKDACLSFSRDRSDIFKKLSAQDMQAVVGKGCPNLFRKVVNSAKRLRIHLNLDEGEVCGACHLRESCDRAYLILKEDEGVARTVDIVRILLIYAIDPAFISSGAMSPARELIELSSRKLLSELVELSETPVDPEHSTPAPKVSPRKKQSPGSTKNKGPKDTEMKRGDSFDIEGETPKSSSNFEMKSGDWVCSQCNFMNFSRNAQCLRCKAKGPSEEARMVREMKKGDWNCPKCTFMNFASNSKCLRCQESRPKRELNPGEWECPKCDFLNYRKNMACKKCDCERPRDGRTQSKYEQQLWTKPY